MSLEQPGHHLFTIGVETLTQQLGLVLFYCTFLGLKVEDTTTPHQRLEDSLLEGETLVFSGYVSFMFSLIYTFGDPSPFLTISAITPTLRRILDDSFEHSLSIFKDEDSGVSASKLPPSAAITNGMRASMTTRPNPITHQVRHHRGTFAHSTFFHCSAPIWTAFITYRIASILWMKRAEAFKVHLADLTRYVFCSDYVPQAGPQGQHELYFLDSHGRSLPSLLLCPNLLFFVTFLYITVGRED